MQISSAFDGGNITVIDASNPRNIQLNINPDTHTDCYQWFYFRITGAKNQPLSLRIVNAGGAYVGSWDDYQAVVSSDRENWFRAETSYENGILSILHTPAHSSVYVAFFAPYTMERHAELITKALGTGLADLEVLGQTLEGRSLDLLTVGSFRQDQLVFWVTARQHPGETMAEWWVEGFLERLLDSRDEEATYLRENAVFYIVPNMNPDGSFLGHLRTNAAGIDLNRAWKEPTLDRSPEVFHTRERMFTTKPDFVLDVHGVESMKHAFIVGPEGRAGSKEPIAQLTTDYKNEMFAANIDFQTLAGFDTDPNEVDDAIASNFLGEYFGCLCMTLEMPFKDTTHTPDPKFGWSPARSMKMGQDSVTAMANIVDRLREEQKAWR